MNLGSWIVLGIVAVIVALAIRSIVHGKKTGKGACSGCSGCSDGAVPTSCCAANRIVSQMEQSARK